MDTTLINNTFISHINVSGTASRIQIIPHLNQIKTKPHLHDTPLVMSRSNRKAVEALVQTVAVFPKLPKEKMPINVSGFVQSLSNE